MRARAVVGCLVGVMAAVAPAAADVEYFAVFIDGQKIGHATESRKVADGKVTTENVVQITMSRAGIPLTLRELVTNVETTTGEPLAFTSVLDMGLALQKIEGKLDGQGKMQVTITSGDQTQQRTMDWPRGALLAEGLRLAQVKHGLKQGTTYQVNMFAGALLQAMPTTVTVGPTREVDLLGRVVKLTELTMTTEMPTGRTVSKAYVDREHRSQKMVVPAMGMNLEMVACTKQVALSPPEAFDALSKVSVSCPVSLSSAARAKSITYYLSPTDDRKLALPATGGQTVWPGPGGRVVVRVRAAAPSVKGQFPYKGKDKAVLAAIKPTRYLQSDDKRIVALARKAVGEATDALQAARAIEAFVREYVNEKNFSVGYATAVEVAESKQGDCTEHAVLAAAMCRALGIPAQVVCGVVYVDQFADRKDLFIPHAWTQVFVGGKWVGLDPALGGFDAGHIALAAGQGDPEGFFSILSTLGYFNIDKVELGK